MTSKNWFKDFFVISIITFLLMYLFLIFINTQYIKRTVEEIVNRSSASVVNEINERNRVYNNIIKSFSNDIRISAYTKSMIYFKESKNNDIFNRTYKQLEDYLSEKKELLSSPYNIIITDFDNNIIFPKKIRILNFSIYENNIFNLENNKDMIKSSPFFIIDDKIYFYLTTYILDTNQIPVGYITFEIRTNFSNIKNFYMEGLKFYIVDSESKVIWPGISLPYFIFSKLFLSIKNESNNKFYFNGKIYFLKKTKFGESSYILAIYENKESYVYSVIYFVFITVFILLVMIVWLIKYLSYERKLTKKMVNISKEIGIEESELISFNIKKLKHIRKSLFKEINTFQELENRVIDSIRLYDDIYYIGFYKKDYNNYNYFEYTIFKSEKYKISNEIIEIFIKSKKSYLLSFEKRLFDFDGFLIIKENKMGDLEKNLFFDGIKYLLNELYIKMNKIYSIEDLEKYYMNDDFKSILIVKFKDKIFDLKSLDIYRSYIIRYKNNYIFLNTFNEKFNINIIDYIEVFSEFENSNAKYINLKIPKYESKRKKALKEVKKLIEYNWEDIEDTY